MKGKFIAFEGIDGSGKSTQIELIFNYLKSKGIECYITSEPTDSPFGSLIHQCMTGRIKTDDKTIAALFIADRLDHLYNDVNGILKLINNGITVLTDRYYFSSYAYHGVHVPMEWVIEANRLSAETLRPDVNIYLDCEPEIAFKRLKSRNFTEKYEKLENMKKVRKKYFEVFQKLKNIEKIEIVKSENDYLETTKKIKETIINDLFGL